MKLLTSRLFGARTHLVRFALEPIDEEALFTRREEGDCVASAATKRRREFATGRRLAHALLAELESPFAPLLPGADRAPLWPTGITGSITHGAGLCGVAVARIAAVRAIGIDVEEATPLEEHLWDEILSPTERERVLATGPAAGLEAKIVFSAKEAFYKAVSKDVGRVLEFEEVELTVRHDSQHAPSAFEARFEGRTYTGTVDVAPNRLVTALVR